MIKKVLTVLLIEDSPEFAELVQRWLVSQDDTDFILNWSDSLANGLNRLAKGGVDAILLDLGLSDSRGLETFTNLRTQAHGVPIVILSGGDTTLALQMVQQGAQDFILKTDCNCDLLVKALLYAVGRSGHKTSEDAESDRGTVIGVMGAKGGVGATTFACNLSTELRRQTGQETLLADLDVNAGLVGFFMKSAGGYSILDAVTNIQRMDHTLWKGTVGRGLGDIDVVRSPDLLGVDNPEVRKIHDVLPLIRMFYRWTVLDLGRMTHLSLSLLANVSDLYLVTMESVPALHETKRTIDALFRTGFEAQRLRVIVNQAGATDGLSGRDLRKIFGIPVYANLPGAALELNTACTRGELLGVNSNYRLQVASLARKIAGLPEETPGGSVSQLRSFAGRFRRDKKDAMPEGRVRPMPEGVKQ